MLNQKAKKNGIVNLFKDGISSKKIAIEKLKVTAEQLNKLLIHY